MDKNAWRVFEQRKALARLRASLMDEASNRRPRPRDGFTPTLRSHCGYPTERRNVFHSKTSPPILRHASRRQ
ncbi:hypothetical protein EGO56_17665 [Pantoea vagans]|nr:hypothetical protein EGO56_17665 [Pantoea vagans]